MTEHVIPLLERVSSLMQTGWGPFFVFFFMTVESSFIPFPSEAIMIPAGFWAARSEFFPGSEGAALLVAFVCGLAGSMAGAYVNYFLALKLGRPFLHRYGKFFFLPRGKLERAEEIFREYGEVTTFVARLIPAIRQLISLPAGVAKMRFDRFSIFTGLGAGIWILVLIALGYHLGGQTASMDYADIVHQGKALVRNNMVWVLLGCAVIIGGYAWIHRRVMRGAGRKG